MLKCEICRNNIGHQNLKYVFQITLGNMSSGKFIFENSNIYYYHIDCLNEFGKSETKFLVPLI